MYENMKNIQLWKYENMQISIYINMHVEKYKCGKCKRVRKVSRYIKKCKVTTSRNFNKETNRETKKKN